MALQISLDFSVGELHDTLAWLEARLGDMRPLYVAIGGEMESRIGERFEQQRDPFGALWKEWAPATVASYPSDGNGRILDRYSDMLNSLNWRATGKDVLVGFGVPYATYHEHGTNKMPRRGLLFADPDARTLAPADNDAVIDCLRDFFSP
ncbi:MAG: phage virion morphogenesis protein [Azoarcus sp.]|jgi:phage gpG-like protein|nr:phage virion morphogenesis protein [Azoarcus sp.]